MEEVVGEEALGVMLLVWSGDVLLVELEDGQLHPSLYHTCQVRWLKAMPASELCELHAMA